jgi:ABC-type hemin transport system ATPase subunit
MAHGDMTKAVNHALIGQNTAGRSQILKNRTGYGTA